MKRPVIMRMAATAIVIAAAGCRSGVGWNPFARPSAQAAQSPAQAPPGQPPASGVVQASYQKPQYVPPPSISPADLIRNENLEEYSSEKKTLFDKATDNISAEKIGKKIKKAFGRGPNEELAKKQFDEGIALFHQKKYAEAAKCFSVAADRWPDTTLEEDALYWLAESYFFDDRYPKASDTYGALLKKYENSRYLIDIVPRQFAIAHYWDVSARKDSHWYPNLTDKTRPWVDANGHAVKAYNDVYLEDSQGPLGDDAAMAIANSYFLHNRFEDAADQYARVCKDFPQSEHQREAHLLGIRAKLRAYQGPQYEAGPLNEAEQLIEQTLTQFPAEMLGEERELLIATKQLIRVERAQREYQAGEYYYKIKYYRAAGYYYAETIREYADTPFAKMAEDRIQEIKNYPPVPRDYFAWLKKILPESEKNH
ncbi:MAG TPA: outer membrane protein assembly factor BamD [Pirellulales bacterium]|nr:outer membrane protein assembly factor BamD [Pirellulales bacterium]